MKEAANSLLKVLEEPPGFATIFLLADNPGALLPTIRSRSMICSLAALSTQEVEQYLAQHRPDWNIKQRALVARLCEGAVGRARSFDLAAYTAARAHALTILGSALRSTDHSELFKVTESYRAGAKAAKNGETAAHSLFSIQDLTFLHSGTTELVRNTDILADLKKFAESSDFQLIVFASDRLAEVERVCAQSIAFALFGRVCHGVERG